VGLVGQDSNPEGPPAAAEPAQGNTVVLLEQLSNPSEFLRPRRNRGLDQGKRQAPRPAGQRLQVQRRLDEHQILELVRRYVAGESVRELAGGFGIHRTTVLEHLAKRDVERRPNRRKLTDAQVAEAARIYKGGGSLEDLGQQFGVSAETVRKELRQAGVTRRPVGRPRRS
jgi:DNA-binding CsgD family transcriptional regulator